MVSFAPGSSELLVISCLLILTVCFTGVEGVTDFFSSLIVTEVSSMSLPLGIIFPFSIVKLILSAIVYPSGAVISVNV